LPHMSNIHISGPIFTKTAQKFKGLMSLTSAKFIMNNAICANDLWVGSQNHIKLSALLSNLAIAQMLEGISTLRAPSVAPMG
jgi:hypothetical protein